MTADVSATVNSWIDSIAFGIIGLVHIFNPEMVLIGGGISREDEHFIRPLREKILNGAMEQFAKDLEVEAAALGNNARPARRMCVFQTELLTDVYNNKSRGASKRSVSAFCGAFTFQ